MADTRQIVIWSLEQECCLRDRKLVRGCRDDALLKARDYSNGLRNQRGGFGVFGDVYVGSCTTSHGTGKLFPPYPERGFVISEAFQQFGGTAALFQICARCPANTSIQGLAGCFGSLYLDLYSKVIERRLDGIVERLGVASELSAAFPATKPIWYGLWAVSPVPEGSLALLKTIISEMLPENSKDKEAVGILDQRQIRDFSCFLKAIDLAQRHKMPLQVSLSPPGHTDFGIYTVFPHCPFCKAFASTELWKRKYPTALQKCSVCGTEFSPAETAASTRMTKDWHDLREILSEKRFREFAYEYLLALGVPPDAADLIVEETEAWEKQRREKASRDRNLQRLKDKFVHDNIFAGLKKVAPPPSEFEDEEEDAELSERGTWFDASNLAEAIRRALTAGISVRYMAHHSVNEEMDRHQWKGLEDPLEILRKWQERGCSEKFSVGFCVPDSFVQQDGKPA